MEPGSLPEWTTQIRRFGSRSENVHNVINRKERGTRPLSTVEEALASGSGTPPSDDPDSGVIREWREGKDTAC